MATATEVKERPVLFSGPMVKAIREGRKTQTRRIIKPQPEAPRCIYGTPGSDTVVTPKVTVARSLRSPDLRTIVGWDWKMTRHGSVEAAIEDRGLYETFCPYGQPGDRLWVRETWAKPDPGVMHREHDGSPIYAADYPRHCPTGFGPWRPSIHMRREYSRLALEISTVRVERLNDISEADAKAEGARKEDWQYDDGECCETARESFRRLWESINGPGSWDANPWVWAITFRVLES